MRFVTTTLATVMAFTGLNASSAASDTARAATRVQSTVLVPIAVPAVATASATIVTAKAAKKRTPKRYIAMRFAKTQKGDPYRWGGTGPSSWDCSGLVQAAYRKAGIKLPRTVASMLGSGKLTRVSKSKARWGDLVFYGNYHVELFSSKTYKFGARKSGTRVGYTRYYGAPRFYRVKGAH